MSAQTQAEIAAQKILSSRTCANCIHSGPGFKRKQPVLKCILSGKIALPCMIGCSFWKREGRD